MTTKKTPALQSQSLPAEQPEKDELKSEIDRLFERLLPSDEFGEDEDAERLYEIVTNLLLSQQPLQPGKTLEEVNKAISDIERFSKTHYEWAGYFEANPEIEAEHVATGKWDSAITHREIIADYENVLNILREYANQPRKEWISVSEQMPEIHTWVLVWIEERKMPFMAVWKDIGSGDQWYSPFLEIENQDIAYWMPLPLNSPPQK